MCALLPALCALQLVLETASEGVLDEWQQRISAAVAREPRRPRRLLVFVNPFGGSRRAAQIWQNVVKPVFDKAGIKSSAVETQHGGHARTLLTSESPQHRRGPQPRHARATSLPATQGACLHTNLWPLFVLHAKLAKPGPSHNLILGPAQLILRRHAWR